MWIALKIHLSKLLEDVVYKYRRSLSIKIVHSQSLKCILPEFSLLLLGRNLNNSGFVNNASTSVSFLHDTNDPSLVSLNFLNVFTVGSSLLSEGERKGLIELKLTMVWRCVQQNESWYWLPW